MFYVLYSCVLVKEMCKQVTILPGTWKEDKSHESVWELTAGTISQLLGSCVSSMCQKWSVTPTVTLNHPDWHLLDWLIRASWALFFCSASLFFLELYITSDVNGLKAPVLLNYYYWALEFSLWFTVSLSYSLSKVPHCSACSFLLSSNKEWKML